VAEALGIAKEQGVTPWAPPHLGRGIEEARTSLEQVRRVRRYFEALSQETGAPMPVSAREGARLLEALEALCQMPRDLAKWRSRAILDPEQRAAIEGWRERAAPILESRRRLEDRFNLSEPVGPETLVRIAEELRGAGLFRLFSSRYKDAVAAYEGLLRLEPGQRKPRESRAARAELLLEWARLLEQEELFDEKFEGRSLFGEGFEGVDTDFAGALEANAWGLAMREQFSREVDAETLSFLLSADGAPLESAIRAGEGDETVIVRGLLGGLAADEEFTDAEARREERLQALIRLEELTGRIRLLPNYSLAALAELHGTLDEALFLTERMEGNASLRAALKHDYLGVRTDLQPIEQGLAFVKFIHGAPIPDELKTAFLSPYGAQRLSDARKIVAEPMPWFAIVREHFRRLDAATRGQVRVLTAGRGLEDAPVPELLERIQSALRQKATLEAYVNRLKATR
jgi:hypothetical protein